MAPFDQIACISLTEDERALLIHLLAEIALADGNVCSLEVELFNTFATSRLDGNAEEYLRSFRHVDDDEIARRGASQAEHLYLYCALLACGDKTMHRAEQRVLRRIARALELDKQRCEALEAMARAHVIDQTAQLLWRLPGEATKKAHYLALIARQLGATPEEIDEVWRSQGATPPSEG